MGCDLWRRLEVAPEAPATLAAWRGIAGDAFEVVSTWLRPSGALASHVPSPIKKDRPWRVVTYRDGSLAAVRDADGAVAQRVAVAPEDVVEYEIDWGVVRAALAKALDLRPIQDGGMLGRLKPNGRAVLWAAAGSGAERRLHIRGRVLAIGKPCIVLTPTKHAWDAELEPWVEHQQCVLIAACDAIALEDMVATDLWTDLVASLQPARATKPRRRRRGERVAKIERIRTELVDEARARVNIVRFAYEAGANPELPVFSKSELAQRAGVQAYDISRAFRDDAGADLRAMYELMEDPNELLRWWGRRG